MILKRRKVIAIFEQREICPFIKAQLFDKDVFLLLDSGSDTSYLDKQFFDSLNISIDIKNSLPIASGEGTETSYGTIKTEVAIGDSIYELPMTLYDLADKFKVFSRAFSKIPVGIIGSDFFFVHRIVLDYQQQALIAYRNIL